MLKQLSKDEYTQTMSEGMADVTTTVEPVIDIWEYVEEMVEAGVVLPYTRDNFLVEKVYRDSREKYDHILLLTDESDRFIVIIVDIRMKGIVGHFDLDINNEYGV